VRSGHAIARDGLRLHYVEDGDGPGILFVPGWLGTAAFWEPQILHFRATHRVVALDPRSQGDSEKTADGNCTERRADDIADVIERLALAPAVVVAWSRAVAETLCLIERAGAATLRGVVLVDGPIVSRQTPETFGWIATELKRMQLDRQECSFAHARAMFRKPHPDSFYEAIAAEQLKTPTNTAVALQLDALEFNYRPALERLEVPVMFVGRGANPGTQADVFRSARPGDRVEIFAECGHAVFLDDPAGFNSVLAEFLAAIVATP
jgi:microsomal epoxide hydrolase